MILQPGIPKYLFDKLKSECPYAYSAFSNWIQEYKKSVKWTRLFRCHQDVYNKVVCDVDFCDLPYAMQFGIFIEFAMQMVDIEEPNSEERKDLNNLEGMITDFCIGYENDLKTTHN